MGNGILVICEHDGGIFKRTAYELLGKAGGLTSELGGSISALAIGASNGDALGNYGAAKVYLADVGDDKGAWMTGGFVRAVEMAVKAADPAVVLAAASPAMRDVLPRVAARLNVAMVQECTDLNVVNGGVVGRRPTYAGKAFCDVQVNSGVGIFTVRPNSFEGPAEGSGTAQIENLVVEPDALCEQVVLEKVEAAESTVADLTEADRIVSGGRSVTSQEGYDSLIRPLANALGATPGASRAAVDAGYAGHDHQVGQTGKVVNPSLYIACGISGAIQHLAGMRTSRIIVAINTDPEAPIFQHATYGIVQDMFEVVPVLTQKLREALS